MLPGAGLLQSTSPGSPTPGHRVGALQLPRGVGGGHTASPSLPPQEWAWHLLQQVGRGMRAGGGLPMPLALPPAQGVMNEVSRPPHMDGET